MEHGYTTGDEYDDADSRGGCYGSGWPSADVPPWNYRPFINQEANKNKHMSYMIYMIHMTTDHIIIKSKLQNDFGSKKTAHILK